MDEKGLRQIRIEHLLTHYRREGANSRALAKERERLEQLTSAELAELQAALNRPQPEDTGGR